MFNIFETHTIINKLHLFKRTEIRIQAFYILLWGHGHRNCCQKLCPSRLEDIVLPFQIRQSPRRQVELGSLEQSDHYNLSSLKRCLTIVHKMYFNAIHCSNLQISIFLYFTIVPCHISGCNKAAGSDTLNEGYKIVRFKVTDNLDKHTPVAVDSNIIVVSAAGNWVMRSYPLVIWTVANICLRTITFEVLQHNMCIAVTV